jgi:hypothetical protein
MQAVFYARKNCFTGHATTECAQVRSKSNDAIRKALLGKGTGRFVGLQ